MKLFPVVMAGGSGTRFWPLSRKARPKQFLALAGNEPLLVATVRRVAKLAPPSRTFVVCGPVHAPAVRKLLPRLPRENVVVEPCARNTAPCVGLAALHVAARGQTAVMAVLPADHHIGDPEGFREALTAAAEAAEGGAIVTIGVKPTRPEIGYGYLQVGARLRGSTRKGALAPREVARFVEKPDRPTAERYLAQGDHLWNSGIFVFRADVILGEIRRLMPELSEKLDAIGAAVGTAREARALRKVFPECESISIDFGVMEKSERIAVVPGDFGWSDVGSFAALPEVREADAQGNVALGDAFVVDGSGNVIVAQSGRAVAVVGLDGVVVVDAGDAVLVCPRDRAQDVRKAVEELKRRGREDLL